MTISQNTVSNLLNIKIENKIEEVTIFNMFGSMIQKEFTSSFSVENLQTGVYILNVKTDSGISRKRFVKQ